MGGDHDIYRRVVGALDDERLVATIAIIQGFGTTATGPQRDPMQTALGLDAFYDGLWLSRMLYPAEFKPLGWRQRAIEHLFALFPNHFDHLHTGATGTGRHLRKGVDQWRVIPAMTSSLNLSALAR